MQADDESCAVAREPAHKSEVPQGPLAVQRRANDVRGYCLQIGVCSRFEYHLANVVANVKIGIEFPGRQAQVERGKHRTLLIARNEIQPRLNMLGGGPQ